MAEPGGFRPSAHGFHFDNSFARQPVRRVTVLGRTIGVGDAANGLCGGMVYAAADLWHAQLPPPPDTAPPAAGSPLFDHLVRRLFDSFDLPGGVLRYLSLMNPARDWPLPGRGGGRARIMVEREWPRVRADIDVGRPCPLGLVRVRSLNPAELGRNHQVLAYGYDLDGTKLSLRVYDPNRHDDDSVRLRLDLARGATTPVSYTGDDKPVFCFFRTRYRFADPAPIASPEARISGDRG